MKSIRSLKVFRKNPVHKSAPEVLKCKNCYRNIIDLNELHCLNSYENICLTCGLEIIQASIDKTSIEKKKQVGMKKDILNYLKKNKSVEAKYIFFELAKEEFIKNV